MTYTVSGGTLNPTHSLTHSLLHLFTEIGFLFQFCDFTITHGKFVCLFVCHTPLALSVLHDPDHDI